MVGTPVAIQAMIGNVNHGNSEVEDLSLAILRFPDGALGQITSSVVHHGQRPADRLPGRTGQDRDAVDGGRPGPAAQRLPAARARHGHRARARPVLREAPGARPRGPRRPDRRRADRAGNDRRHPSRAGRRPRRPHHDRDHHRDLPGRDHRADGDAAAAGRRPLPHQRRPPAGRAPVPPEEPCRSASSAPTRSPREPPAPRRRQLRTDRQRPPPRPSCEPGDFTVRRRRPRPRPHLRHVQRPARSRRRAPLGLRPRPGQGRAVPRPLPGRQGGQIRAGSPRRSPRCSLVAGAAIPGQPGRPRPARARPRQALLHRQAPDDHPRPAGASTSRDRARPARSTPSTTASACTSRAPSTPASSSQTAPSAG